MKSLSALIGAVAAGAAMLATSAMLLTAHLSALGTARDAVLPLAAEIPPLEHRLDILKKQLELTDVQASLQSGSASEKLAAYVLPQKPNADRLVAFFDVTGVLLQRQNMLKSFSSVTVGKPVTDAEGFTRRPVTVEAVLTHKGTETMLKTLDLSGLLTVGDTLTEEEWMSLFTLTEAENYAGIVAVEQFLSADLAAYARDPRPAEDRLLKTFSSERFLQQFRAILGKTRLQTARDVLGGDAGEAYALQKVWPVQFLVVDGVSTEDRGDGWEKVSLRLSAYSR
jgi:hypothetical protein